MTKLSHNLQNKLLKFYVFVQVKAAKPQSAQGALEYIAIAVALVVLVAVAFTFLGQDIGSLANKLVCKVTGNAAGCNADGT